MKKTILILTAIAAWCGFAMAQDVIVLNDGEKIKAQVLDIGTARAVAASSRF